MNKAMNKSLNVKYTLSQVFYNASACAMFGFVAVYLLAQNFSNSAIGITLALCSIVSVFLQPMMASIADKSEITYINKILQNIILIIVVLSAILYIMPLNQMIIAILIISIFSLSSSMMPLMNSLTFVFEDAGYKINFGIARGLGSGAYALTSSILGFIVTKMAPNYIPLTYVVLNVLLYVVIHSYVLPGNSNQKKDENNEKHQLNFIEFCKKYKKFIMFLVGFTCIYIAHGIINSFLIQIVMNVGGDSQDMGNAAFVAAILELPIMFLFSKINEKIDCATLIKFSLICFTIKHILTFLATNMAMIYLAQIFQMGAFALYIPASVYYVKQKIDQDDLVKGQSCVTVSMTLSGIFASLMGGILLDTVGVHNVLLVGAIFSVIGMIIGLMTIEK